MSAVAAAAELVDRSRHGADFDDSLVDTVAEQLGACLADVLGCEGCVADVDTAVGSCCLIVVHNVLFLVYVAKLQPAHARGMSFFQHSGFLYSAKNL